MKRLLAAAAVLIVALTSLAAYMKPVNYPAGEKDSHGHALAQLWARYYEAHDKDRPQTEADILSQIKDQAKAKRLHWDFYDAWREYVSAVGRRNWKERNDAQQAFIKAVKEYDEPIVSFASLRNRGTRESELLAAAKEKMSVLKAGRNSEFYNEGRCGGMMGGQLVQYIRNDYEYVLWETSSYEDLKAELAGLYPCHAYAEYMIAQGTNGRDARRSAIKDIAEKYKGKAIGMYAEADILSFRFDDLNEAKAKPLEYKKLYDDCQAFEKARKSLTGKEASLVKSLESIRHLSEALTSSEANIQVKDNSVMVLVRNLSGMRFSVYEPGSTAPVHRVRLDNSERSFYCIDTLRTELPKLNDGEYRLEATSGNVKTEYTIRRHSVSLAFRTISDGIGVYAAEQKSGCPIEKADLVLRKNGSEIAREENFRFDGGFTKLPESIASAMKGNSRYALVCEYKDADGFVRRSEELSIFDADEYFGEPVSGSGAMNRYCNVYTDRGAYNPGETVRFKAVLYSGNMVDRMHAAPSGTKAKAFFKDSEGNEIAEMDLVCNDHGSVAGEFTIPEGLRGGMFHVGIEGSGYSGGCSIRVDEYVLPTFEIRFDEVEGMLFPGSEVTVSGKVISYSGHSLSDARVSYEVTNNGSGELSLAADGSFEIKFKADSKDRWAWYEIRVKVVDPTGETQEASTGVSVNRSFYLGMRLQDTVNAQFEIMDNDDDRFAYRRRAYEVVESSVVKMEVTATLGDRNVPVEVAYVLENEKGDVLVKGSMNSGSQLSLDMSGYGSGIYTLKASSKVVDLDGKEIEAKSELSFLKVSPQDVTMDAPVKHFFRAWEGELENGEMMKAQLGSADGPVWAVVELYGTGRQLLERRMLYLAGNRGEEGSLANVEYEYKAEYPDAVRLQIFYFKDGSSRTFQQQYRRRRHTLDLPLEWMRFEDRTVPGHEYSFGFKTSPEAEVLAAIYDESYDRIYPSYWNKVYLHQFSIPSVYINAVCGGQNDDHYPIRLYSKAKMAAGRSITMMATNDALGAQADMVVMEESLAMDMAEADASLSAGAPDAGVAIRSDFAGTLAFEPFLRPDEDGNVELKFRTSDKLSTYKVMLYAHDPELRNELLSRTMLVTIPVKVAVVEPGFLYVGDKYEMAVSVSSNSDQPVSGTLWLYQYDGKDWQDSQPVKVQSSKTMVPANGNVSASFEVDVPGKPSEIGLKVVFVADEGSSDGVFVSVPVYAKAQTLTEAHSAVILPGMDIKEAQEKIRSAFVNVSPYGAEYKEISIIDMVKEAIPDKVDPDGDDVLSLSEAWYVRLVARSLGVDVRSEVSDSRLVERILACKNADGGFGWFEGMESSPVMTAVLLERFAKIRSKFGSPAEAAGLISGLENTVKYLDSSYFRIDWPFWCGGISADQYLYVRSMYPSVAFDVKGAGSEFDKRIKEFRKYAKDYLLPKENRGLQGQILAKARRLKTLAQLVSSDEGLSLATKWGIGGVSRKMVASLEADVVSLLEYASDHKDGGMYYPNAVMPYRGLLESEAYAHSLLCDLFTDYAAGFGTVAPAKGVEAVKVADGIRIWLMLQKETQKWGEEPAYVDALNSVMRGSDEVKATKVILLSKTYEKPFDEINAAGNGFRIERRFVRDGKELREGAKLNVGDRVTAEYRVWNGENRSFVVLRAPREAMFRPVHQLSGMYGWGVAPLRVNGWFSFRPHGYRNVKNAVTEYWFDSYPEEDTVITEEFYVTQQGVFSAPVVEIESVYAPHYRANGGFGGAYQALSRR